MTAPAWLKSYYGDEFSNFDPEVVKEGKAWAVVKLKRLGKAKFSGVGYVLVKKKGNHQSSQYQSLHEGLPSPQDLERMYQLLEDQETAVSS